MLDVACGAGRHLEWFHGRGHPVTGVDRDLTSARAAHAPWTLIVADIEASPWPLVNGTQPLQFGAVVVTNYLWRALLPTLAKSVLPGGVLLYETFGVGNEILGRPSRPDFLLRPGELLELCSGWHIVAYEHGRLEQPARVVQRIAAIKALPDGNTDGPSSAHAL